MAAPYVDSTSSLTTVQESGMYRLSDELIRQEALGVALRLKGADLSDYYRCQNYFRDTSEWWVCRAAERAADFGLVTRANLYFRPHDTLTLAEGLGITLNSLAISHSSTSTATIPGTLPAWQKRLILTIQEQQIALDIRDSSGRSIAFYDPRLGSDISGFNMSHRLTRGEFFQIVIALLHFRDGNNNFCDNYTYSTCPSSCVPVCRPSGCSTDGGVCTTDCDGPGSCVDFNGSTDPVLHCTVYNDGCNDCVVGDEGPSCTKRQCIWQGTPSCSACEAGYAVRNGRCVRAQTACIQEGQYAGGGFVYPPENPDDFVCCSGLTSAPHKDGDKIADIGNVCIRANDYICDSRYESSYNSGDCRLVMNGFDDSICQSYYDGCNSCSRTSDGQTVCTLRACFINGPAYCTSYIPYVPKTQTADSTFLSKVVNEMRTYAKDLSCTDNSQCQWAMVGYRACGGPSTAIAYSRKNVTQSLIDSKDAYITDAEEYYNQYYGIMSDCMYIAPPHPMACINGFCQ